MLSSEYRKKNVRFLILVKTIICDHIFNLILELKLKKKVKTLFNHFIIII